MRRIILIGVIIIVLISGYFFWLHYFRLELFNTFLSEASGAAFGGFLGSCIIWLVREIYVFWRKQPEHVVTYYISENPENLYGKMRHERGERILGLEMLKERLGKKIKKNVLEHGVWEYKLTSDDRNKSKMAFYGPSRYDLTEPGTYEASFFYFGRNFSATKIENPMLFHLEVLLNENHNYYMKKFDTSGKEISGSAERTAHRKNVTKGKKFLYYKDFLGNNNQDNSTRISKIRFYYNGIGEFEFKAYVPDDPQEAFQNVVDILNTSQIYFYKIEINRIFSIEIPETI